MKLALDTSILIYAEGVNGAQRREQALALIARIPPDAGVIAVQALGELFHVLVRKAGRSRETARNAILSWRDAFTAAPSDPSAMLLAVDLAADHQLGIWDALILAAASQAGCRLLLSEDLQDGFTWGGVTVVNPFAATVSPMLAAALQAAP
ncbi:MAG: PIN domain-containing protein [Desulfovibrionaceae bacterium]|nr:PIN domain-containing protein [Desulfovibrionaceae bacterium]